MMSRHILIGLPGVNIEAKNYTWPQENDWIFLIYFYATNLFLFPSIPIAWEEG